MRTRVATAKVAAVRPDLPDPAASTGLHADLRTERIAFERGIDGSYQEPVSAIGGDIAIKACRPCYRSDQEVDCAVAVHVAAGEAAGNVRCAAQRRVRFRDIAKAALAVADKQEI